MSDWVAGAGLSVSEGSPGVSGLRPPTPATLASIAPTDIDRRFTSALSQLDLRVAELAKSFVEYRGLSKALATLATA